MSQKDGDQMANMEAWQPAVLGEWNTNQSMVRPMKDVPTFSCQSICFKTMLNITSRWSARSAGHP